MADILLCKELYRMYKKYQTQKEDFSIKQYVSEMMGSKDDDKAKKKNQTITCCLIVAVVILIGLSLAGYWFMIKCEHGTLATFSIVVAIFLLSVFPIVTTIIAAGYFIALLAMKKKGLNMCGVKLPVVSKPSKATQSV